MKSTSSSSMKKVKSDTLKKVNSGTLKKVKSEALKKAKQGKSEGGLKKSNLKKLGQVPLDEKVRKILTETPSEEAAAAQLKLQLTKVEHSKVWSQHQTHLSQNPTEGAEHAALSKKEKGLASALWFVRKQAPRYMHIQMKVESNDKVERTDQWQSLKQVLDKFGQDEMDRHLVSGRLLWREDPLTKGVYQYKDQGDIKRCVSMQRGKTLGLAQEYVPEDDTHEDWFAELFDKDCFKFDIVFVVCQTVALHFPFMHLHQQHFIYFTHLFARTWKVCFLTAPPSQWQQEVRAKVKALEKAKARASTQ